MGKIVKNAKVFRDWEGLILACIKNGEMLPNVGVLRADLERILAEAKEIKAQQEYLEGSRQGMTQRFDAKVEEGEETARLLRSMVKVHLGSKNELLVQFGIPPIRRRGGRKSKTSKVPVTPGTTPPTPPSPDKPAA